MIGGLIPRPDDRQGGFAIRARSVPVRLRRAGVWWGGFLYMEMGSGQVQCSR